MIQYLTKEELEKLKKKLDYLKNVEVKEIAELIRHTASFGDLKENSAYTEAKEKQAFLQGKILELADIIRNTRIIEKKSGKKVQPGSEVMILFNNEKENFRIVAPGQVDSLNGKISYESPLGKRLLGKKIGDKFKILLGNQEMSCEILEIK